MSKFSKSFKFLKFSWDFWGSLRLRTTTGRGGSRARPQLFVNKLSLLFLLLICFFLIRESLLSYMEQVHTGIKGIVTLGKGNWELSKWQYSLYTHSYSFVLVFKWYADYITVRNRFQIISRYIPVYVFSRVIYFCCLENPCRCRLA